MKLRFEKQNLLLSVNEETLIASAQRIKSKAKIAPIVFNYRFRSLERMNEFLEEYISRNEKAAMEREAIKNQKKLASEKFEHPYKVGQIMYESWGYDQTNIDFYQIIEIKGKSVLLYPINGNTKETGFMCGKVTPIKDSFVKDNEYYSENQKVYFGSPLVKRITASVNYSGNISFTIKGKHRGYLNEYFIVPNGGLYCSWYA